MVVTQKHLSTEIMVEFQFVSDLHKSSEHPNTVLIYVEYVKHRLTFEYVEFIM